MATFGGSRSKSRRWRCLTLARRRCEPPTTRAVSHCDIDEWLFEPCSSSCVDQSSVRKTMWQRNLPPTTDVWLFPDEADAFGT